MSLFRTPPPPLSFYKGTRRCYILRIHPSIQQLRSSDMSAVKLNEARISLRFA